MYSTDSPVNLTIGSSSSIPYEKYSGFRPWPHIGALGLPARRTGRSINFEEGQAMKRLVTTLSMLALASLAMASDGVSPDRGQELFTSKQLGTNGKSCNICHPGGKGLENAAVYDEGKLGAIINQCITNP